MNRYPLHIDGKQTEADGAEWFDTEDPYTGEVWAQIARGGPADVDRAVHAAHTALTTGPWAELTPSARGRMVHRLGDAIATHADRLARIEVRDNGKLLTEMRGQLDYIPQWFYYYGGLADKLEGTVVPVDKKGFFGFTSKVPIGVVGIITPWNSPLLLLTWKLAPALAAGCTVVIKPSEFTSASTLEFVRVLEEAGLPAGVVNVVTGFGADVGSPLVDHPQVAKISFTGSDTTGRRINQQAAETFKHVSLELGGKSPNIVFADADLDSAVNGVISGIFAATGQTCIAGSRLLVQRQIHDEFVERVVALAKTATMGNPLDAGTQVGPVTTPQQYAKVLDYIQIARAEGATCVLGGAPYDGEGARGGQMVQPTIFTDVDNGMRIAQEEVFGPVLSVIRFDDEADALRIANDIIYGLAAGVWTSDIGRAIRMADGLEAGTVWVNTYRAVSFTSPFGGYKRSGIGRESGAEAIKEYTQTKSVWISTEPATGNPFVLR